jgi:hypothetical protein
MSERFKLENIKQVSLVRTRDIIEFCGIEADTGVVHWLSEDEYKEIHGLVKNLGSGPYRNQRDEAYVTMSQQLEQATTRAARVEELAEAKAQESFEEIRAAKDRIAELESLVSQASSAITEMKLRAQVAEVAKADA